ncbi:hypothetical protein AMJ57_05180 [Parcubacteria bacterium SG8_24]|nr:MAG: hypothetical protein AMJ57_05180 [Parcubacteria bacterium SG8_24]
MIHAQYNPGRSRGFTMFYTSVLVLVIFLLSLSLIRFTLMTQLSSVSYEYEFGALQAAEAGIQKALFCLNTTEGTNCGGAYSITYTGETDVDFGDNSFTTVVTGSGSLRDIESTGTTSTGRFVKLYAKVSSIPDTDEMALGFALQSGNAGAHLENGATINGTLYANGDVECVSTQAVVDGDIFVAKSGGWIDGCQVNYHAYADIILDCNVNGHAYYRNDPADIAGTTVGGTKYPSSPTPTTEDLPEPDYGFWQTSAEAGGTISGDHTVTDGQSIGPIKVDGNLIFEAGASVTITGPIWAVGDVTTGNGTTLQLDPAYTEYSTVILADDTADPAGGGHITLDNGTSVLGTGDPQSHIMFISTNQSLDETDAALDIANNAAGAVFLAPDGVLRLRNNAGAKSLSAKKLWLDNNAVVTYVESDLADIKFSNSPSAAWGLVGGSWRMAN